MAVEVGDEAPDFELLDQHYQPVRLSDFRGKRNVVVVFYPATFTNRCQGELCSLRDEFDVYHEADAQLLAISVDSAVVHKHWADEQGYQFPVLADFWPHGAVAERYGVLDPNLGVALRATFIIDRDGVVRWRIVNGIPEERDQDEYRKVLAEIG